MATFQGKRVEPDEGGWLHRRLQPGEYCLVDPKVMADGSPPPEWMKNHYPAWYGETPNGHGCNLHGHQVTVHEDGTITVSPSILVTQRIEGRDVEHWHGYLERGVWRDA